MRTSPASRPNSSKPLLVAALVSCAIFAVCVVVAGRFLQLQLMEANQNGAVDSAQVVAGSLQLTDADVAHLKTLDFNQMEADPLNRRLADIATGFDFAQPVISVYVVVPLEDDEVKYQLDESTASFWNAQPGTSLDGMWLLNMAVDAEGNAVFAQRDDLYRYTVLTDDLRQGFQQRAPYGSHTVDEWGDVITGHAPLYTEEGTYVGTLGIDLDMAAYNAYLMRIMLVLGGIMLAAVACVALLFVLVYRRYVRAKTAELAQEHENAQLAARERELLSDILNNIAVGVYVLQFGQDGCHIVAANSSIVLMLGRDRDKLVGAGNDDLLTYTHPEDADAVRGALRTLSAPGATISLEYRLRSKETGRYLWVSVRGRSAAQADGSTYAYVCFVDVTEEKRLRGAQTQLEVERRANQAKSNFMSTMSHDMRTPLNTIINLAVLAHEDCDDPRKICEDLDKIELSGTFLLGLINDVLDLSKIENGKMELHPSLYRSKDFAGYVEGVIAPLCQNKDIAFEWDRETTHQDLWVDKTRFNQLFFNLLSNAVKYTRPGGTVRFGVEHEEVRDGFVTCDFVIADNGMGMAPEFQQRMFLPFEREHEDDGGMSTGLGLAIVRQIVDLMGGSIAVESEPGNGTTFTVHLSLAVATPQQRAMSAIEEAAVEVASDGAEQGSAADGPILIVEDQLLNREIAERLLERKGYRTKSVQNGQEAVDLLSSCEPWHYRAVLMDLRMPVMGGLEATRAIRSLGTPYALAVPIIAMTADAFEGDVRESLDAGMDAHLSKPIVPAKLYSTLAMLLHRS